mmetsp:Transcript_44092/g.138555  ORF Transcript_44092/g.138555 Transcript_44092/m.138555 type:complete len:218 (+) Transcript_44092:345-998(+)
MKSCAFASFAASTTAASTARRAAALSSPPSTSVLTSPSSPSGASVVNTLGSPATLCVKRQGSVDVSKTVSQERVTSPRGSSGGRSLMPSQDRDTFSSTSMSGVLPSSSSSSSSSSLSPSYSPSTSPTRPPLLAPSAAARPFAPVMSRPVASPPPTPSSAISPNKIFSKMVRSNKTGSWPTILTTRWNHLGRVRAISTPSSVTAPRGAPPAPGSPDGS